jgi:hypothetical protein
MGVERDLLTAAEMDAMTPDERAAAVRERIATDLDEVPEGFRVRIEQTGQRLAAELGSTSGR